MVTDIPEFAKKFLSNKLSFFLREVICGGERVLVWIKVGTGT